MSERLIITAKITTNAEKMWQCRCLLALSPSHKGELPIVAGQEIRLYAPGETPSPFCQARRAWTVIPEDREIYGGRGLKVCEHQVDLPEEEKR